MTITELKRKTKVGDTWTVVAAAFNNIYLNIPRKVGKVQTNSVALFTTKSDGTESLSWLNWPKAKEYEATPEGFKVFEDGVFLLEYKVEMGTASVIVVE